MIPTGMTPDTVHTTSAQPGAVGGASVPWWESFGTGLIENVTESATTLVGSVFDGWTQALQDDRRDTDAIATAVQVQGTTVDGSPAAVGQNPQQNQNQNQYVQPTLFGYPQETVLLGVAGVGLGLAVILALRS